MFLLPDRNISHMFLIKNNRCTKVKDMQNTVKLCCTETEMWFVGSLSVFLSSHQRISWNWRSGQVSSYLSNLTFTLLPCKRPLFSFCLLEWWGETDALPEPRQAFDVAKSRTSWLVNLVSLVKLVFRVRSSVYWTKPAVSSERLYYA